MTGPEDSPRLTPEEIAAGSVTLPSGRTAIVKDFTAGSLTMKDADGREVTIPLPTYAPGARMSWVVDAIGQERVARAREEASRRRVLAALTVDSPVQVNDVELAEVGAALELQVFDLLVDGDADALRKASVEAFQVLRALCRPADPVDAAAWLLRISCIAVLGDRGADARRLLVEDGIPDVHFDCPDWGRRVWVTTLDTWLRVIRKHGWEDLDRIQANVVALREAQRAHEPGFLERLEELKARGPAWQLMAEYHLAKAAEVLAVFLGQGSGPDGRFDIHQQLEAQFDRALGACGHGRLVDLELLIRLLARAAAAMVDNSIWTVTRAVNSRVTRFVQGAVSRSRTRPLFEMLPPQRRTLREEGLLGSGHRSVVVSLPTSSGKTMIAQFRILQALNQFDRERGWVAYLAPTRALVKQIAVRLRRDFAPLGINVERVSPALEVDGIEATLLTEQDQANQFRVLVTTPEKLDLMLRGDFGIELVDAAPKPAPTFDFRAAIGAPGPDLTWGAFSAAISTLTIARPVVDPVMVVPVRIVGHRGAWLTRSTGPEVEHNGHDIAVTYSCFGGLEWRRKAPARLRRLTAQRRMQAERKAEAKARRPRFHGHRMDEPSGALLDHEAVLNPRARLTPESSEFTDVIDKAWAKLQEQHGPEALAAALNVTPLEQT